MPELTKEEALESESAWTDEELEWIYSVGGHVYGDASDEADRQREREEESARSIWDSISDYFSDIYEIAKGAASDVITPIWDWLTERFDRQEQANALLFGDVSAWTDEEIEWIDSVGGYVYGDASDEAARQREREEESVGESKGLIFDWIDAQLEGIAGDFAFAFQHLAPVFAALLEIPAMAFFKYLSFLTQPPGAEEG